MKNKKASWADAFCLNWRAARIWFDQYPNMFYSAAADYGLKTILPYVTIWFSAQIINELTGNRDPNRLLKLVISNGNGDSQDIGNVLRGKHFHMAIYIYLYISVIGVKALLSISLLPVDLTGVFTLVRCPAESWRSYLFRKQLFSCQGAVRREPLKYSEFRGGKIQPCSETF